jgi:signal transduction histidine kinase
MRTRSLHAWLALALAAVIVVPALVGAGTWLAVSRWQSGREQHRLAQATDVLRGASLDTRADRTHILNRFAQLGVEGQVGPTTADVKSAVDGTTIDAKVRPGTDGPTANPKGGADADAAAAKLALSKPIVITPGLLGPDSKRRLSAYRQSIVTLPNVAAQVWVPRESAGTRWAFALGAGLAALAGVLVGVLVLLRRWVLRPLAGLAADADRIAGGELDVDPVPTRAREIAQVGEALRGMADGLREALASSSAAERERRFMVTAIAHDLRTPLFTLRGSLEAIERGVGDGNYLDRAQDKAAHLDRLVSDLFTFSRLEYAGEAMADREVDLAEVVRRAAETVEPLAAARGCALVVSGDAGGLAVRGDAEALLRVLTNLLDNATRHGRTQVTLAAARRNGSVRVDVADDGPGFPPEDLERVFDPLFRSDRARAGSTGGTGLGLAIARRLARAHGGDVEASNDPGGGARATVTLPAA